MKIRGIGCSMPERVVTNAEILQELMELSDPFLYDGQKEKVKSTVNALFRISGSRDRRRRNNGDRAYDYAHRAVQQALEGAQMRPDDIDLLIYVGVGRGWVEPGMATFFLHKFGMSNATGFDILDACLSWMRALHIGYHFIKNGVYKNIMVLNAEFNYEYHGPIKNPDEVAYRFAQLTIGESATATILSAGETGIAPHFEFKTDPSQHDLCKIPLPNIASYSDAEKCPQLDPLVFFAYSAELFNAANEMVPALYFSSSELQKRHCDIAFAHSASKSIIDNLAKQLDFGDRVVNLFPEFGNTVSASIPTAMCWALENGRLKRDMEMMLFMGSAGFSVGICHMVY
jgi:3-oxoacyl-[acyl-carrier-protein] synthase III